MIAVDASVLIAHLDPHDSFHDQAGEAISECPPFSLAASVITIAEVLAGPQRHGRLQTARGQLRELAIETVALDDASAIMLADLRARTNLKLPDCCVLHAAQTVGATRVLTFDSRLAAAARDLGIEAG